MRKYDLLEETIETEKSEPIVLIDLLSKLIRKQREQSERCGERE